MREKLNQFIDNLNGQFVEISDRTNIFQCMDLAYLWVFCLGFPKATIQHLYAYEAYTKPTDLTRQYFDLLPNTAEFIPQDGDITVFDKSSSNVAGHIGIALGGGSIYRFNNFEQNWPLGTNASIRLRDYNNPKLLGVLRPKVTNLITDQTKIPQINNMEVQAIRSQLSDQASTITNLQSKIDKIKVILAG